MSCVRAAETPTEELLASLEQQVVEGTLRVARHAAAAFARERIYGFWLFEEGFANYATAALTETTLDAALAKDGLPADSPRRDAERWRWEYDETHYIELDDRELSFAGYALEKRFPLDSAAHEELCEQIERISLRALRRVREERIFGPEVVVTLAALDLSLEEAYAYAELLCPPATLAAFRRDAPYLLEDHIRQYRERIAGSLAAREP